MSSLEMRLSNFGSFSSGLADLVFEDGAIIKLGAAVLVYAGDASSPNRDLPRQDHRHLKGASQTAARPTSLCLPKTRCKPRA